MNLRARTCRTSDASLQCCACLPSSLKENQHETNQPAFWRDLQFWLINSRQTVLARAAAFLPGLTGHPRYPLLNTHGSNSHDCWQRSMRAPSLWLLADTLDSATEKHHDLAPPARARSGLHCRPATEGKASEGECSASPT